MYTLAEETEIHISSEVAVSFLDFENRTFKTKVGAAANINICVESVNALETRI